MQDPAQPETWFMAALKWIVADCSHGDLTLLGVIFTLNAGFSAVDILVHGIVTPLRAKLRKRLSKYRDANWMRAIAPSETERDQGKRDVLAALVTEVEKLESEIPELFKGTSRTWKWIMAGAAAIALVLMAIPYSGRIVIVLALTVPLFYINCRIELSRFNSKLDDACRNLDKSYTAIKTNCNSEDSSTNVSAKLTSIESKMKSDTSAPKRERRTKKK